MLPWQIKHRLPESPTESAIKAEVSRWGALLLERRGIRQWADLLTTLPFCGFAVDLQKRQNGTKALPRIMEHIPPWLLSSFHKELLAGRLHRKQALSFTNMTPIAL